MVVLNGGFSDVGSKDTHKVLVNWGDGTQAAEVAVNAANRTFTGAQAYATGGMFEVTVPVIDDDGGSVVSTTHAVVEGVGVVDGTWYIIRTDARDHVKLKQDDKKGTLKVDVKLNQGGSDGGSDGGADRIKQTFVASTINRIVAFLFDGDDHYDGGCDGGSEGGSDGRSDAIPHLVFGGNGNDLLIGGSLVNDFNDLSVIGNIDAAMAEWAIGDLADTFSCLGTMVDEDEKDDCLAKRTMTRSTAAKATK